MSDGCFCCVPHFVARCSIHHAAEVEEEDGNGHDLPPCSSSSTVSSHGDLQERTGPKVIVMSGGMGTFTVCAALLLHAFQPSHTRVFSVPSSASTTSTAEIEKARCRPPPSDVHPICAASSPFLSLVAVPDGVSSAVLQSVADAVEQSVHTEIDRCVSSSSFTTTNVHPTLASWKSSVQVLPEGMSTRERSMVYERGGVVVGTCRVFCVDILHRRLSPSFIRVTVFLLTREVSRRSAEKYSSPLSLLFPSSSFSSALSGKHARRSLLLAHQEGPRWKRGDMFNFAFLVNILRDPPALWFPTDGRGEASATAFPAHVDREAPLYTAVATTAGSSVGGQPPSYVPPMTFFLSDDPIGVQFLAQSHQKGFPRFFTQLAVEEIMLFPRFRLEIMKFYEKKNVSPALMTTSKTTTRPHDFHRRIHVHRILVPPSRATNIIDHLLEKILQEIGVELREKAERIQRMEEEKKKNKTATSFSSGTSMSADTPASPLAFPPTATTAFPSPPSSSSWTTSRFQKRQYVASAMDETVPARYMPLSTPSLPSSSSSTTTTTTTASSSSSLHYIRKPWRDAHSPFILHFTAITSEMAADVSDWELDEDLSAAVFAHARTPAVGGREADATPTSTTSHTHHREGPPSSSPPPWPYHALVYSLLDVRQLRRDLHRLTPYDFLWALQCALRLSKKAAATLPGLSTSPTPLWTLSSSFYDLVMAATERVGSVVAKKEEEDDDDEEEEKQHPLVEPMTTTAATATTKVSYVFQPHPIHTVDPVQEVLVTMISSWCRTKAKKRSQGQKAPRDLPENVSNAPPLARRQCREAPGEDDGNANTHASTVVCTDSVLAHPPPVPPLPPSFLRPTATPNPSTSPTHASLPPPATTTTTTTTTTRPVPHVLLVIDFGADAILRTVQRLLYGKTHYPHLLLNRFLSQYQRLHYRPPLPSPEASPSAVVDDTTTTALSSLSTPTHAVVPLFTHSEATRATGEQSPREKEKKTNDEAEGSPAVPPPPSSSLVSPVDAPSSSSATTAAAAAASSWTARQWRKVLWNNDGALETEMTLQDLHGRIKKEEKDDEDDEDEPMGRSGRRSTAGSAHRLSPKGKTEANEIAASRHRHRHSQDHTRHTVGEEEEAWKEGDGESEEEKDDDAYTEERLMEFARLFSQRAVKDEDEDDDEEEEEDGKRKRKSTKNRKKKRPTKASDKKKGGKEEEVDGDTDEPLPGSGTDLPMDSLFSLPSLPEGILHPPSLPTSSAVSSSPSSRMPSLHEILMRQPLAPPPPPPAWFSRSSPSPSLAGRRTTTESEGLAHVPTNEAVMVDDEKDAYTAASDALSNVAGRRHHRRLPQKPAEVPMTVVGHKNENKRRKCEGNATTTTTPVVLVTEDDDDALPMPSSSSLPTSPPAVLPSGSTPSGGVHPTSTKWPDHTHASAAVVIEEEEAEEEEDVIVMDRNEYSSPPSHKGKESMRKRKKEMKEEEEEEEEVVVVEEGGEVEEEEGVTVSLPHPATTTTTTTTTRSSHPRLPTAKTLPPSSSPSNASPLTGSSPSPQDVPFELREWSASCAILEAMMGPPPRGGGEGEAETKNPQSGGTTTSHFSSTASSTSPPTASASPVAVVVVLQGDALEDETLRQWLMGTHPFFSFLSSSSSSSSSSSPVRIRDVILTKPDMVVLRQLETFWNDPHSSPTSATASSLSSSSVRVRLLVTPFSEWTFQHHVQAERTAFLSLGHAKATLPGTLLMSRAARQAAEFELASGLVQSRRRGGEGGAVGQFYHRFRGPSRAPLRGDAFGEEEEEDGIGGGGGGGGVGSSRKGQPPTSPYKETPGSGHAAPPPSQGEDTASSSALVVLFDDREFRSHLPYALHASGMEVVPLTLRTADYVLSPEMAVERKSIPDLLQSLLHSGRLMKQLAALSAMYPLPVCLIEGSFGEPYRLVLPSSSSFPCSPGAKRSGESVSGGVYDTFSSSVYYRLGRLYGKFPGLCIWWTKNALHTAAIFRRMKCTVARRNASALNPALTMSAVALQEEEDDVMGVERSRGGRCPTRGLSWGDERQPPSAGIRRDADVALVLAPPPAERGGEGAPLLPADEHASTDSRPKGPEEKKDGRAFASSSLSLSVKGTPRHPPSVAMLPTPPPPHFKKNATMSVLAGKILHCFPGVTSANATGVMQLAGSLVGLSTIAKESLRLVMSEEEAEKLYSFLHSPIIEDVG